MSAAATESADRIARAPRFPRVGHIHAHDTHIAVWEENVDQDSMFAVFAKVCTHLHSRGFTVRASGEAQKHYKCLSRTWRVGIKNGLEYEMMISGRTLKLDFFQNINIENPNGGKYDYARMEKMPRAMRLLCLVELRKLVELYLSLGYELGTVFDREIPLPQAVRFIAERRQHEDLLKRFNDSWDFPSDKARGVHRFQRDESGWPSAKEYGSWPTKDRDGKPVAQGSVKYYRTHDGYLRRAQMFGGINGNWMMCSPGRVDFAAARETFDCERPELERRRVKPKQAERVERELSKAKEAKNWKRVAVLAAVLERGGLTP